MWQMYKLKLQDHNWTKNCTYSVNTKKRSNHYVQRHQNVPAAGNFANRHFTQEFTSIFYFCLLFTLVFQSCFKTKNLWVFHSVVHIGTFSKRGKEGMGVLGSCH